MLKEQKTLQKPTTKPKRNVCDLFHRALGLIFCNDSTTERPVATSGLSRGRLGPEGH